MDEQNNIPPQNGPEAGRIQVYDSDSGTPDSQFQTETVEFHIREPFRISSMTWFSLAVLIVFPLTNLLATGDPEEMIRALGARPYLFYISTMIFLWMLFLLIRFTIHREQQSIRSLGITRFRLLHLAQGFTFFLVSALILKGMEIILSEMGYPPVGELSLLLPKDTGQRVMWVVMSFTAGFCEESAYRGYFITRVWRLAPDSWPGNLRLALGVGLSSLAFGLGHTYQGVSGLVLIATYGLLIAGLFLYTRSLWPCVTAHFLLDFMNLFVPMFEGQGQ